MSATAFNRRSGRRGEGGQALILLVGLLTVLLAIAAIVIDFGLWLGERRDLQSVADLAALAGSQDLPGDDNAARTSAFAWAAKNGFQDGADGVEVTVELLCKNTLSDPPEGVCTNSNPPGTGPSICQPGAGCDSLRVTIRKPVEHLFTQLFGIADIEATSGATAVAGVSFAAAPLDTLILRDVSGSMLPGCNNTRTNPGCPIKEARDAANGVVDMLADGSPSSRVGYIPYNYCYASPPPAGQATTQPYCVSEAHVISLTTNGTALHESIDQPEFPHDTNICLPLLRANQMFNQADSETPGVRRSVLLLSGGDNTYSSGVAHIGGGRPERPCRPTDGPDDPQRGCGPAWDEERELDVKTYQQAQQLKARGVEIFVFGLNVCGTDDGRTQATPGYCNGIGDTAHDNVANQRLLKCIASSPDNYFRVSSAEELPEVFQEVAGGMVGRGLLR